MDVSNNLRTENDVNEKSYSDLVLENERMREAIKEALQMSIIFEDVPFELHDVLQKAVE